MNYTLVCPTRRWTNWPPLGSSRRIAKRSRKPLMQSNGHSLPIRSRMESTERLRYFALHTSRHLESSSRSSKTTRRSACSASGRCDPIPVEKPVPRCRHRCNSRRCLIPSGISRTIPRIPLTVLDNATTAAKRLIPRARRVTNRLAGASAAASSKLLRTLTRFALLLLLRLHTQE